ncbi:MAG: DUF4266 domain-containing protein [Burkholderiales bacterium]|nr:DUF4266 domain-containing protein [Burkholderiales bacterium]
MTAHIRPLALFSLLSMLSCGGCTLTAPVQPWEKNFLAKNAMKMDHNKLEMKNAEHIYTSKEAAVAASSVGGGGCGCN